MTLVGHGNYSKTVTNDPLKEFCFVANYEHAAKLCMMSYFWHVYACVCNGMHPSFVITCQPCLNAWRGCILQELDCGYSNCCSVCICIVFNDAASSSESTALNNTVLENNDSERMQQEVTVYSSAISLEGLW